MSAQKMFVVIMATLTSFVGGTGTAASQEREPGAPARVLQQPAPLLVPAKAELTCTAFASRDQAGMEPIDPNRALATNASHVWVHRAVKNEGQSSAEPFSAEIKITGEYSSVTLLPYQQEIVGPLPPGGSHAWPAVPVELVPGKTNIVNVWTRYDYADSVDESDEYNVCQAHVNAQTPPAGKPKDQVASQAAQSANLAAQAVESPAGQQPQRGQDSQLDPSVIAKVSPALLPAAPDVTCTAWASRNKDGTGVIPNGSHAENTNVVYLHVTVRNLGPAEAKNFNTRIKIDDGDPDNEDQPWIQLMTLEPGLAYRFAPRTVTATHEPFTPYLMGAAAAEVVADVFHSLPESNESNNECDVGVSFRDFAW